ncbi:hypothetical protein [Pedobacter nutrimenti]|uniref:hypothetical protein n=1 Tax=Pedobacter nutrimenti TaxID=1241337 RepID=UPI0029300852|nr:hypothetical protein [Pedobacter nutrimenti]
MEASQPLKDFFEGIDTNPRIGTVHIAVFMALYYKWLSVSCSDEFIVFAREMMPIAKISCPKTYYEALKGLKESGYIGYERSYKRTKGSRFYFI